MERIVRNPIRQNFLPFALTVGVTATPLNTSWQQANLSGLYEAFIVSVPKLGPHAAAGAVLLGDSSISVALNNGLEILPGVPVMFSIDNERQLYEVQAPLITQTCETPESIPVAVWDVSNIYLVAAVSTVVGVILFPKPYV